MSIAIMVIGALNCQCALFGTDQPKNIRVGVYWTGVLLVLIGGALYSWGPE